MSTPPSSNMHGMRTPLAVLASGRAVNEMSPTMLFDMSAAARDPPSGGKRILAALQNRTHQSAPGRASNDSPRKVSGRKDQVQLNRGCGGNRIRPGSGIAGRTCRCGGGRAASGSGRRRACVAGKGAWARDRVRAGRPRWSPEVCLVGPRLKRQGRHRAPLPRRLRRPRLPRLPNPAMRAEASSRRWGAPAG